MGPKPRRRYAYSPPASGIMEPNSRRENARKMERIAPMIHAAKTTETLRLTRAISAGFRKIPVPIIVPTTMAAEAHAPSPRTSSKRFSLNYPRLHLQVREVSRLYGREIRLTIQPTTNVTIAPIITYHVNATFVNRNTHKMAANPTIIPANAPRAFAARSSVPSKKRPSKLPNGSDATVNPASRRSGPHFTRPKPIRTIPQKSVMPRESRRNWAGSALRPRSLEKSRTLEAARELSDPLALDMATAT